MHLANIAVSKPGLKKEQVLGLLEEARQEIDTEKIISLYSEVVNHHSLISKDSSLLIIKEGLDFAKHKHLDNNDVLSLKRCKIQIEQNIVPREKSIKLLKALLEAYPNANYSNEISILLSIGTNYRAATRFDSALIYLEQAKVKAEEKKDIGWMSSIMAEEIICYIKMSSRKKGYEVLDEYLKKYPSAIEHSNILHRIMDRHYMNGEFQKIVRMYDDLLKTKTKEEIARSYKNFIGQYIASLISLKKYHKAESEIIFYLKYYNNNDGKKYCSTLYFEYSNLLILDNREAEALPYLDSSMKARSNWISKTFLARYYKYKAIAYSKIGPADSTRINLHKMEDMLISHYETNAKKGYSESIAFFETKKKEQEISLLQKENEITKTKNQQWRLLFLAGILVFFILGAIIYNKLKRNELRAQQALVEAELTSIRSQMNPHFMFNALNSIKSYIIKNDTRTAAKYLGKFASLMRGILDLSSKPFISLQEELDTLQLYVEMEELRFKNQFTYDSSIQSGINAKSILVPPLFLQPFIENSIKHGLIPLKERKGELQLTIVKIEDHLVFKVIDNGIGRSNQKITLGHKSQGMDISLRRIKMLNKNLTIKNHIQILDLKDNKGNACGTEVTVKLAFKIPEE